MVRRNREKEGRVYRILKIIVTSPLTILVIWILIVICALLLAINAEAKDFGVVGKTREIKEVDAIEEIKGKLSTMERSGELGEHNERMKEVVSERIRSPKSLNVGKSDKVREYEYDPSIIVAEDLRDARGVVFHRKGTRVNPLDMVSMP